MVYFRRSLAPYFGTIAVVFVRLAGLSLDAQACPIFGLSVGQSIVASIQDPHRRAITDFAFELETQLRSIPERDARELMLDRDNPMSPAERYIWVTRTVKERLNITDPARIRSQILSQILNKMEKVDRLLESEEAKTWEIYSEVTDMGYLLHWLGHIMKENNVSRKTVYQTHHASLYFYLLLRSHPKVMRTDVEREKHAIHHILELSNSDPSLRRTDFQWRVIDEVN